MKLLFACILCLICSSLCAKESEGRINSNIIADYAAEWGNKRTAQANCLVASHASVKSHCQTSHSIDLFYLATAIAHIGAKNILPGKYGRYLESSRLNFKADIKNEYTGIAIRLRF